MKQVNIPKIIHSYIILSS